VRVGTIADFEDLDLPEPLPRRGRRGRRARRRRSAKQRLALLLVWSAAGAIGLAAGLRASEPVLARLRPGVLAVESVAVVGAHRAPVAELVEALGLAAGTPVLAVDAPELRRRVEEHPWVARARVSLLRPGRILVAVEEREPSAVAVLGSPPTRFWLDAEGVPFLPVGSDDASGRIAVVGPPGAQPGARDPQLAAGAALARALAARGIAGVREVRAAGDPPAELPVLVLESGTRVALGAGDTDAKLERLAALLRARLREVAAAREIDLRFGDRMVLRGGPTAPRAAGDAEARGGAPPPNPGPRG
jgi:cell division protein FtsQ